MQGIRRPVTVGSAVWGMAPRSPNPHPWTQVKWIQEYPGLTCKQKLALMTVARHEQMKSGLCFLAQPKLAALLGVSVRTSRRVVGKLVRDGFLRSKPRIGQTTLLAVEWSRVHPGKSDRGHDDRCQGVSPPWSERPGTPVRMSSESLEVTPKNNSDCPHCNGARLVKKDGQMEVCICAVREMRTRTAVVR